MEAELSDEEGVGPGEDEDIDGEDGLLVSHGAGWGRIRVWRGGPDEDEEGKDSPLAGWTACCPAALEYRTTS